MSLSVIDCEQNQFGGCHSKNKTFKTGGKRLAGISAMEVLDIVGLTESAYSKVSDISQEERKRTAIALA